MRKKDGASAAENVKVLVRCRPLSEKEKGNGHKTCVDLDLTAHTVTVNSLVGEPDRWTFDAVINNTFTQKDVFTQFIMPLVDSVLDGFNATVFAYGQSGSGKTHTMTGVMGNDEMEGVIPRCFKHIFESVKEMRDSAPSRSYSMYVSFVELYNGKVRDLLAKQQVSLDVRENKDHTFFVQGAHIPQVKFPEDIIRLMEEGTDRRRTASTELNADSSRSHSLFTLILECTETLEDGTARSVTSKLNLVDLAGSERQGKTGASGDTLKEGCNINLSLSALGTVIDTIVKGGAHVPFRSSPLTMLLKDSLGGNSKTVMFANINPSERNLSETISTLRFADRAKQIKNKPVVNMDTKDQKIAELTQIVNELREKLKQYETSGTESLERELEALRGTVGELEVSLDNAVKGREADAVDFENAQAKLVSERQAFNAKLVEMEDQLSQQQNDLHIAEAAVKDAETQQAEVLHLCATHLCEASDKPITTVDELTQALRNRADGGGDSGTSAELAHLQTQIETLTAENRTLKKGIKATKKDNDEQIKESKRTLATAKAKLSELKKELGIAREAVAAFTSPATPGQQPPESAEAGSAAGAAPPPLSASQQQPATLQAVAQDFAQEQHEMSAAVPLGDEGASALRLVQEQSVKMLANLPNLSSTAGGDGSVPAGVSGAVVSYAEMDAIKTELEEEKAQRQSVEESREKLYAELEGLRQELVDAEAQTAEASGKMNELRSEHERMLVGVKRNEGEVTRLEARLRERSEQLEQVKVLMDKQKSLIVKSNEKSEFFQQKLKESNAHAEENEVHYRQLLEEKDENFQRLLNQRLEAYEETRKQEISARNRTNKKTKKKMQKIEEAMIQLQKDFDMKVCECEDLRNALGEQKVEHMRLVRRLESSADEAEVIEKKEQIQNALERAKEERKRREDLFAMGEVKNAKHVGLSDDY